MIYDPPKDVREMTVERLRLKIDGVIESFVREALRDDTARARIAYEEGTELLDELARRAALAAERGLDHTVIGSTIRGEGDGVLDWRAVRAQVIEECAKACDALHKRAWDLCEQESIHPEITTKLGIAFAERADAYETAASRIRSLGEEGKPQ